MGVWQLTLLAMLVAVPAAVCFVLGRLAAHRGMPQSASAACSAVEAAQRPAASPTPTPPAARSPTTEQLLQQLRQARDDEQLLGRLAEQIETLVTGREDLRSRLESLERRFNQQAAAPGAKACPRVGDLLAALPDSRAFEAAASEALRQAHGADSQLSVLLIDVDHFQRFSATHGRDAGDEALRSIAQVLLATVDAESRVARYGESEFAVLLPNTGLTEAAAAAERVRTEIAQVPVQVGDDELPVTISGGLATAAQGESLAELIARADQARAAASLAGGDRTLLHDGAGVRPVRQAGSPGPKSPQGDEASAAVPETVAAADGRTISGDSRTDAETGLRNQTAFLEDLRRRVAEWRRFKLPISVMCVEVDDLAGRTQALGFQVGSLLTRAVTQFLATALRDTDLLARLPDARFGIILPGTDSTNAVRAAERIRGAVSLCRLSLAGRELGFSISVGVANVGESESAEGVLERAAQATDVALARGGNSTILHDAAEGRFRPGRELFAAAPALARC